MAVISKMICVAALLKRIQYSKPIIISQSLQQCRRYQKSAALGAKMYMERENNYAYNIMESKGYTTSLNIEKRPPQFTPNEFQVILANKWDKKNPQQIFEHFALLGDYCSAHGLCISSKMFDEFIDRLTDNIKLASDIELECLIQSLLKWPDVPSMRTRNFIEVWAALDDACLSRIRDWSLDQSLVFISHFYMLNIMRSSDFCKKALQKLASKVKKLNNGQFVQTMFYIGVTRRQPFDMHNLELHLNTKLCEFTLDELAIISMGFFKSKTPIRNLELVGKIADRVRENSKSIHEVSLAALLKIIRYSMKIPVGDKVFQLLDELQHELARLSVMCNVHIALLGTATLTLHKKCLTKIADSIITRMSETRLKDLERLVLTYATFNYIPPTKDSFFEKVIEELRNPVRIPEIENHGRSFVSCIEYLSIMEKYPLDLIKKALSPEFLKKTYGNCFLYDRSVLAVHNICKLYCSEANINCLTDKETKIIAKKFTDFVPDESYPKKYNVSERMFLDVMKILRQDRGEKYVIGDHIVTHHQRGDIILCNAPDGSPLPVKAFETSGFGLLREPPDNNIWIALIIAGRNAIIHGTDTPTGHFLAKVRVLNVLGFHANLVPYSIYNSLDTDNKKISYLNDLIIKAIKNK